MRHKFEPDIRLNPTSTSHIFDEAPSRSKLIFHVGQLSHLYWMDFAMRSLRLHRTFDEAFSDLLKFRIILCDNDVPIEEAWVVTGRPLERQIFRRSAAAVPGNPIGEGIYDISGTDMPMSLNCRSLTLQSELFLRTVDPVDCGTNGSIGIASPSQKRLVEAWFADFSSRPKVLVVDYGYNTVPRIPRICLIPGVWRDQDLTTI